MAFEVGYEVAPEYRQIPHDPDEEKCRVRVTLASDSEDLPSFKFEAGGRSYCHACQEAALVAIGELLNTLKKSWIHQLSSIILTSLMVKTMEPIPVLMVKRVPL